LKAAESVKFVIAANLAPWVPIKLAGVVEPERTAVSGLKCPLDYLTNPRIKSFT
jgi:hypothetical protein